MSARRRSLLVVLLAAVAALVLDSSNVTASSTQADPWSWGGTCYMNNCLGSETLCFSYKKDAVTEVLCIRN